jgi:chloride channel protein, CIC family
VVLIMELTGHDRSFILPLLLIACIATMVSRTIEPRSVYDARLSDEELRARQRLRERSIQPPEETPQQKQPNHQS